MKRGHCVGQNIFEIYKDTAAGARQALAGIPSHDISEAHGVTWENWYVPVPGDDGSPLAPMTGPMPFSAILRGG